MSRKSPDFWLEIAHKAYPAGTTTTRRYSTRALAFPSFVEGRVRRNGWSEVSEALTDHRGRLEASVLRAELEDSDGQVRAHAEAMGVDEYAHPETTFKLLSEAGRKAGLTARVVHRGKLARPVLRPRRQAALETADLLGSSFYIFNPEAPFQRVYIDTEHLAACGLLNTPPAVHGKPYNIVVGEQSSVGLVDESGAAASAGMVPCDDLGDKVFTSSHEEPGTGTLFTTKIPPPILTAVKDYDDGDLGDETYTYFVSMITSDGETTWSNGATIHISRSRHVGFDSGLNRDNFNHLSWVAPSGWEAVYESRALAFRVMIAEGETSAPTAYLDIQNNGGTFVDPEYEYNDGEIANRDEHDIEKLPVAPEVGTAVIVTTVPGVPSTVTTDAAWGFLCYALGYSPLDVVYGSDLTSGDEPKRVALDPDNAELMTPLSANWPHADPWVELDDGDGNVIRVSGFYAKGVLLKHHRDGDVTFAVDTCGVTDTGDDGGTPVTEMADGILLLLNEFHLKDDGAGYRTGPFWPVETFTDGTPMFKTTAFDAAQAVSVGFIGGRGYQINYVLTEEASLSEVVADLCKTFNCWIGPTNGQIALHLIDDERDTSSDPIYRMRIEIDGPLPEPTEARDEVENRICYKWGWCPDRQEFLSELLIIKDDRSQAVYGVQKPSNDEFLGLRATLHRATATDAMARRLLLNKVAPIYQPVPIDLRGLEQPTGGYFRLTHPDGYGVDGYSATAFFCTRRTLNPNAPNPSVVFVGRNIQRLLGLAFGALGDESTMTGNLGDETSALPPPTGAFELRSDAVSRPVDSVRVGISEAAYVVVI